MEILAALLRYPGNGVLQWWWAVTGLVGWLGRWSFVCSNQLGESKSSGKVFPTKVFSDINV